MKYDRPAGLAYWNFRRKSKLRVKPCAKSDDKFRVEDKRSLYLDVKNESDRRDNYSFNYHTYLPLNIIMTRYTENGEKKKTNCLS